ncbi:glycoside hydrolase family 23 protein [Mycena albidolilacea]|uniref:Glycoside hydrolase family 23 protein n=1 Tax=Mycena albidolilacea TaxID=1033008 RepID=A0AAD7EQ46_9AGAR|nr:glycoside hydrolase family 23 protein [Mycena albidolilacea]
MLLGFPVVILSLVLAAQANIAHGDRAVARHHARVSLPRAPLESSTLRRRKSCNVHTKSISAVKTTSTHTTTKKTTTAAKKTTVAAQVKATPVSNQAQAGTIKVSDTHCGSSGATTQTTSTTGPNGALSWMNCGIESGGWNPPHVEVKNLVSVDLKTSLKDPNSPFAACAKYVAYFYQYADEYGLEAIMLAAFALQESSCNPETVGGGGEQGLMQITKDKCGGAPGGNCRDPSFNIKTGAAYFAGVLRDNGGNVLAAVGEYNGWAPGLTKAKATAARYSECCTCQNNLDYLHQYFNGWLQGKNAYALHLGKYFNLDVCPDKN